MSLKSQLTILLFFLFGCQKITNQLPGSSAVMNQLQLTCFLNSGNVTGPVLDVVFNQTINNGVDTVWYSVRNSALNPALGKLLLIVEVCNSINQNYSNCWQVPVMVDTLLVYPGLQFQGILFIAKNIMLDAAHINVGILSYEGYAPPYDGDYNNGTANIGTLTSPQTGYAAKGYVLADGSATFRLLSDDNSVQYNVKGGFGPGGAFNGYIYSDANTAALGSRLSGPGPTVIRNTSTTVGSFSALFSIDTPIAPNKNILSIDLGLTTY